MRIGVRQSFTTLSNLEESLKTPGLIELALPHKLDDFMPIADKTHIVAELVMGHKAAADVLSIHATQGDLSRNDHLRWTAPAMELADMLGASHVVFHPARTRGNRYIMRQLVLEHLDELRDHFKAIPAIETFTSKARWLTPVELMELELPMVLDTSHIVSNSLIHGILGKYSHNVVGVHLSARTAVLQHQPIDAFCIDLVKRLQQANWPHNIILEYLPEYHDRLQQDSKSLIDMLTGATAWPS